MCGDVAERFEPKAGSNPERSPRSSGAAACDAACSSAVLPHPLQTSLFCDLSSSTLFDLLVDASIMSRRSVSGPAPSSGTAHKIVQMGAETVQMSQERLNQAGSIDDDACVSMYPKVLKESGLNAPEAGKLLYSGVMFKEGHIAQNQFQSRVFKLRLERDWTPMLTYANPGSPDTILGEHHLKSFTFVPTKQGRKEHVMSWRLDATGVSLGKSKNDKLVLAFKNREECQLWQAAFNLCRTAEQVATLMKRKIVEEENARLAAAAEEEERLERERVASIEQAIVQSMLRLSAEEEKSANHVEKTAAAAAEAAALASVAAAEAEAARLAREKEEREEEEARIRLQKEQAEAEEAQRVFEKEAAEAEAARLQMTKEEQEAADALVIMEKEKREAEEAKAKFDKEQAEFLAAAAEHAKEFEEAQAAARNLERLRELLLRALDRKDEGEIQDLKVQVAAAEKVYEKEAAEAAEALARMKKEEQEAEEARAAHEKEQEEADAATAAHAKEEAEAAAARAVYQKEEQERVQAQLAYEKEKAEADSAQVDYDRESAEAAAARQAHLQKEKDAEEALALQRQKERELADAAAADAKLRGDRNGREAEEKMKAHAAASAKAKTAPKAAVDPELASAAREFVTLGGALHKYMRAKLIDGKLHEPRPKTVKMNGSQIMWDKRVFAVANAKVGGSMLLRANSSTASLDCNFHCFLSGVASGQDQLDFRASSKEEAEKWVMGVLACIGKL